MSFSFNGIPLFLFCLLFCACAGYLFGRIRIGGISFGTAGVLITALLCGIFVFPALDETLGGAAKDALKIIENLGLILFVCSVGFIAGPNFFRTIRTNIRSYALLCFVIIFSGGAIAALILLFTQNADAEDTAMIAGLFSGALTSTPAFSAAKSTVEGIDPSLVDTVTVGNGIAYIFGVVGKVLFIQLIPLVEHADMARERERFLLTHQRSDASGDPSALRSIDPMGFAPFLFAGAVGLLIGRVTLGRFSLTTTGGCLFVALILGHFGRIKTLRLTPDKTTLTVLRELGLTLFLLGAGIAGGAEFVSKFRPVYFLYGILLTVVPLILGYLFAKHVLKLPLLTNLGSITGGMTSTPALGTLIQISGTEEVAAAYATTYPIALITVVFVSQALILLFS